MGLPQFRQKRGAAAATGTALPQLGQNRASSANGC